MSRRLLRIRPLYAGKWKCYYFWPGSNASYLSMQLPGVIYWFIYHPWHLNFANPGVCVEMRSFYYLLVFGRGQEDELQYFMMYTHHHLLLLHHHRDVVFHSFRERNEKLLRLSAKGRAASGDGVIKTRNWVAQSYLFRCNNLSPGRWDFQSERPGCHKRCRRRRRSRRCGKTNIYARDRQRKPISGYVWGAR